MPGVRIPDERPAALGCQHEPQPGVGCSGTGTDGGAMTRQLCAAALVALFAIHAAEAAEQTTSDASELNVLEMTITDVQWALGSTSVTCRSLVELYLKRIEAYNKRGPELNAVQTVNPKALSE